MAEPMRIPLREPPADDPSRPAADDLRQAVEGARFAKLKVAESQDLPATGTRLFRVEAPLVDELDLVAGAKNVVPHGLGRAARELEVTPLGNLVVWLDEQLPDGLEATRFVCLGCSANGRARVGMR